MSPKSLAKQKGSILIMALVFTAVFLIIVVGLLQYISVLNKASNAEEDRERAFEIAEAGINRYQWVLTHNPEDYCDGTADPCPEQATHGPFVHEFSDPTGGVIGHYELEIDEPALGSTIATVRSTGYLDSDPNYQRTVEAQLGIPSLANFLFLCNSNMAFSENSHVFGQVHSNGGIRFDGENDSIIQSAQETYWCQPIHGCAPPQRKAGVWGTGGPQDLWNYPVPEIVFSNYLSDLNTLKDLAIEEGLYLPPSDRQGYHLTLLPGGQIQIRVVRSASQNGINHEEDYDPVIADYPSNGVLFVEDDLWIDGQVDGRLTIAAGEFPVDTGNVNIIINDNITYTTGMGTDALGLIAQQDIEIGRWLPNETTIYATMFAQTGKVYRDTNNNIINDSLTIYGGLAYNEAGYFKRVWFDWVVSGYRDTYYYFDASMMFSPPPHWPTSGTYDIINWREI
ncbi:PilX N-terminal domain-containing pilus assembly protein [Patescibacteria group bacterium]